MIGTLNSIWPDQKIHTRRRNAMTMITESDVQICLRIFIRFFGSMVGRVFPSSNRTEGIYRHTTVLSILWIMVCPVDYSLSDSPFCVGSPVANPNLRFDPLNILESHIRLISVNGHFASLLNDKKRPVWPKKQLVQVTPPDRICVDPFVTSWNSEP